MDTFRVFIVRIAHGTSPFHADRNHIHHRLMALGLGHRGTVLVLYSYAIVIILLSLVTRDVLPNKGLLLLGGSAFLLAAVPFLIPLRKRP